MFEYIYGKIAKIYNNDTIILETNKIGYLIIINNTNLNEEDYQKIYIYNYINDNSNLLYGFLNKNEKEVFSSLLKVKNIGTKTAFQILKNYNYTYLINAIINKDEKYLKSIPKINDSNIKDLYVKFKNYKIVTKKPLNDELINLLKNLGYEENKIYKVIPLIKSTVQNDQIKEAINLMEN